MSDPSSLSRWHQKFAFAISGLMHAIRTQNSFWVHIPIAIAAVGVSAWLRVEPWRWVAVIVCIGGVLSAELLNSAIEEIVGVVHPTHDQRIGRALDAAAAAVLVAAIGAAVIGLITLGPPLWNATIGHVMMSGQ